MRERRPTAIFDQKHEQLSSVGAGDDGKGCGPVRLRCCASAGCFALLAVMLQQGGEELCIRFVRLSSAAAASSSLSARGVRILIEGRSSVFYLII